EALHEPHLVAERGKGSLHLVRVGAFDHRLPLVGNLAVAADLVLDLGDRVAGDGGQHIGTAEGDAAGVVPDLVEARRRALGRGRAALDHGCPARERWGRSAKVSLTTLSG